MFYTSPLQRCALGRLLRVIFLALLLWAGFASCVRAVPVAPPLGYVPGEVLVGLDPLQDNMLTQALLSGVGTITQNLEQIHAYRLHLPATLSIDAAIAQVLVLPGVVYATPNATGSVGATPNDSHFGDQPGFLNVNVDKAWNIWHPTRNATGQAESMTG